MQTIKDSIKTITVSLIALSMITVAYAWTEPTSNPPDGNVSPPINTSSTTQIKLGAFGVSGVFSVGTGGIKFSDGTIQTTAYKAYIPPTPAPTVSLSASPTSVVSGGSSKLIWSSTNATNCTASGSWSGSKSTSGSRSTGALTSNQFYTLTCTGTGGNGTTSVTITATSPAPTVSLSIDQAYAQDGIIPTNYSPNRSTYTNDFPVTLRWSTSNAISCVASGSWSGGKTLSGAEKFYPTSAVRYTITCSNATGSTSKARAITVVPWSDVVGKGNPGESCKMWLARTGQAGIDGSEPIAPQRYQDHGYGECWYYYNLTQDADAILTYFDPGMEGGSAVEYSDYPYRGRQEKNNFYTQTRK